MFNDNFKGIWHTQMINGFHEKLRWPLRTVKVKEDIIYTFGKELDQIMIKVCVLTKELNLFNTWIINNSDIFNDIYQFCPIQSHYLLKCLYFDIFTFLVLLYLWYYTTLLSFFEKGIIWLSPLYWTKKEWSPFKRYAIGYLV